MAQPVRRLAVMRVQQRKIRRDVFITEQEVKRAGERKSRLEAYGTCADMVSRAVCREGEQF